MNDDDLNIFIKGIKHYFSQSSDSEATVHTPYLQENTNKMAHEYTGIIGISGRNKGCVYFTAPELLLQHLLKVQKIFDTSHENLCDLVGEIANTISGNARRHFGSEFMISVPVVVSGQLDQIKLPKGLRSFIIPITWLSYEGALVICIE
ncbi:MAG: chemotaxis protein CheX [Acidiferrobacterales bacterium]|nr:chemotaxis protein CheX [Acidiferrobacterales bacterium]